MDRVTRARARYEAADAAYVVALATGKSSRELVTLAEITAVRLGDYIAAWAGTTASEEPAF